MLPMQLYGDYFISHYLYGSLSTNQDDSWNVMPGFFGSRCSGGSVQDRGKLGTSDR